MLRIDSIYLELERFVFPIRPRDIPKSILLLSIHSLCVFMHVQNVTFKGSVPLGITSWSALGKQIVPAKEVYFCWFFTILENHRDLRGKNVVYTHLFMRLVNVPINSNGFRRTYSKTSPFYHSSLLFFSRQKT